jgi:hypothetical protein
MGVTRPTIVAVYKKIKGRKVYMKVFTDLACIDPIITVKSRKLPPGTEILDLGIGESFINRYKKKYKL